MPSKFSVFAFLFYFALAVASARFFPWENKTIGAIPLLMHYQGWTDTAPDASEVSPLNSHKDDDLNWQWPHWIYYKKVLRSGDLPIWNWSRGGGREGILNFTNGGFSLSFAIFALTPNPAKAIYYGSMAKLVLFAFGFFLLLRLYFPAIPALFGGLVAEFCGWNVSFLQNISIDTAVWTGFLIWAGVRFVRRERRRDLFSFMAFSSLMLLSGMPSIAAFSYYAAAIVLVVALACDRSDWTSRARVSVALGVALVASMLVCAIPILSFFHALSESNALSRSGESAFQARQFLAFWDPYFDGANIYPTTNFYIGKVSFFLFFGGLAAFTSKRFRSATSTPLILASLLFLGIFGSVAMGFVPRWISDLIPLVNRNPLHYMMGHVTYFMIPIATLGFAACLEFLKSKKFLKATAIAVIFFLQFNQTGRKLTDINNVGKVSWWYPETPTTAYIAQHLRLPFEAVVADLVYHGSGNINGYGFPEWFAHDIFSAPLRAKLLEIVKDGFVSNTAARFSAQQIQWQNQNLISLLGIRYIAVQNEANLDQLEASWKVMQLEPKVQLVENLKSPNGPYFVENLSAADANEPVKDWNQRSNVELEIDYRDQKPGWVVLPAKSFKGWHAKSANKDLELDSLYSILPAIKVDGPTKIKYRYEPPYMRKGIVLTLLTIPLIVGMFLVTSKTLFRRGRS